MKHIGIALLGLGVVGSGTYKILQEKREEIKKVYDVDAEVVCVLERDLSKADALNIPRSMVWNGIEEVCASDKVDVVAEFFGGTRPAKDFLAAALRAGKNVVTSNKELLAKHWKDLEEAGKEGNACIFFEASCVGGVPVIRALEESMQGNDIKELYGIVNGTTNYILSDMTLNGSDYQSVLKECQRLGYAEANPAADVEGYDSTYKLSILSSLAFRKHIDYTDIKREGITEIAQADIAFAKENGYVIKLLAIAKNGADGVEAHVHPVLVPSGHLLASVSGSFNALYVVGDNVGELMFYGRGAGMLPTGSAIVSDIIFSATRERKVRYPFITSENEKVLSDFQSACYLRFDNKDKESVIKALNAKGVKYEEKATGEFAAFVLSAISESLLQSIIEETKPLGYIRLM
ncbi:MAG: homoserine dehydrogenase [Clostridia bacterium]|nr:homoserine dehydrogenase [Clostridia bacterium]